MAVLKKKLNKKSPLLKIYKSFLLKSTLSNNFEVKQHVLCEIFVLIWRTSQYLFINFDDDTESIIFLEWICLTKLNSVNSLNNIQ